MNFLDHLIDGWLFAFAINFLLIAFAQRIPLLTTRGWIHAGALGTILWGCLGWRGWLAVVLFLCLGSFVTLLGFAKKQSAGIAEGRGGRRGPENVWGSAATGAFLAILLKIGVGPTNLLMTGFAASFAAKLADTFGSEIGKRWGKKHVLITSLRIVPAGTDGAISMEGTFASFVGSFLMTGVMVITSLIPFGINALLISSTGFVATLLESFFGASLQHRLPWISNESVNALQTTCAALIAITVGYYIL